MPGLWSLGLREGTDATPAERRDLLANLLGLRIVLCLAGVVVGVLFTALTGRAFSLVWGVAAVGLGLTIAMLQQAVSIHLQLDLRYPMVALLEFVKTAALTITYAVLVLLGAGLGPFVLCAGHRGRGAGRGHGARRAARALPASLPQAVVGANGPRGRAVRDRDGGRHPLLLRHADRGAGIPRKRPRSDGIRIGLPHRRGTDGHPGAGCLVGTAADGARPDRRRGSPSRACQLVGTDGAACGRRPRDCDAGSPRLLSV